MADDQLLERFVRVFPRGTILFREGDPGGEMFVLRVGKVAISRRVGRIDRIISTLSQGEFFGEMSILTGRPRAATAQVAEDAQILVIDARTFEVMLRSNAEVATRMVKKLAERLGRANDQVAKLLQRDASIRVIHWLVTTADASGQSASEVELPFSPEQIPMEVGAEPAAVEEVLARLRRARFVSPGKRGILVPDVGRLRQLRDFLQSKAPGGDLM
jgi:CRP/FNR family cyclic AMP-dependent transcriptional regulator